VLPFVAAMSDLGDFEEMVTHQTPAQTPLWKQFVSGGVGGAALVLVGHPLDTIKVKVQTMTVVPGKPPPYSGTFDCAAKIIRAEGPRGLYRGMSSPLVGVTPMYALCFFGYGVGKKIFCQDQKADPQNLSELRLHRIALAGATSAVFSTPILAPLERVKCVLQVRGKELGKNATPIAVGKKIYAEGGIRSLNRGFMGTMSRDAVASLFYFGTYEALKFSFTPKDGSEISPWATLTAGGFAGMLNWAAALPIDTLKSKLQIAPEGKYPNGMRSVFAETMRTEGFGSLYRGFAPVMIRAFPANAACFFAMEWTLKILNQVSP
jgi:solute carrier family 25 (mitochondrial carnitine/acylcarnitine transporter), member 20/29